MEDIDGAALQLLLDDAAGNAQLDVLQYVVESCNVTANCMSGALHRACEAPLLVKAQQLVDRLTEADAKAAVAAVEAGDNPLGAQSGRGDSGASSVKFLNAEEEAQRVALRQKADAAAGRLDQGTSHRESTAQRYRRVVLYCLHRGGARRGAGAAALAIAAAAGNSDLVELLLAPGVCAQAADGAALGHALTRACRYGHVACAEAILNACRAGSGAGVDGSEALCVAAASGHVEALRVLLAARLLDLDLNRAVLAACEANSDEARRCVGMLTDAGADPSYLAIVERMELERVQAARFEAKRARQREARAETDRLRAIELEQIAAEKAERRRQEREAAAAVRSKAAEHAAMLSVRKGMFLAATPHTMAQLAAAAEERRAGAGARAKEAARVRLRDVQKLSVEESLTKVVDEQESGRVARQQRDDLDVEAGLLLPKCERGLYALPVRHLGKDEAQRFAFVSGFADQRVTGRQQEEWKIRGQQQRRVIQMMGAALVVSPTKHFESQRGFSVSPVKLPR